MMTANAATEAIGTATYSPDDNKLRLYPFSRLDPETYGRVKSAGFSWAPKQQLFVASMWTPQREDLLIELCGEIGDEDKSLVDRAEERAERFEEYSEKRKDEASTARKAVSAIADKIPFGQPILVGHHSERHARRDAERIENGMRNSVRLWETSKYWIRRAQSALAHARYKEDIGVRARRIKSIEADKRKQERYKEEAERFLNAWSKPGLTLEEGISIANYCNLHLPRKEGDRKDFDQHPSAHTALTNAYPSLYAPRTLDEVVAAAKVAYPRTIVWCERWIAHYENRLAYENAMLADSGGLVSDRFDIQLGGQVLVRGEWVTVLRLNKKGGKLLSVTTNARYVSVRGVDEIKDYKAPTEEQAAKVAAVMKKAPLCNYPGESFKHVSQADWDKCPSDYKTTTHNVVGTNFGRHRVRKMLGVYAGAAGDSNDRHRYHLVFITDAKRIDPPIAKDEPKVTLPGPVRDTESSKQAKKVENGSADAEFESMKDSLKAGVQVVAANQLFPTPDSIADRMVALAEILPIHGVLEPSAGMGSLMDAVWRVHSACSITAVEINQDLADRLKASGGNVYCTDFLDCTVDQLGMFERIVMNPPFENGSDIRHVKHALNFLSAGGRLVGICANGPRQNEQIKPMASEWIELAPGTFSGTNVRSALFVINH